MMDLIQTWTSPVVQLVIERVKDICESSVSCECNQGGAEITPNVHEAKYANRQSICSKWLVMIYIYLCGKCCSEKQNTFCTDCG